MENKKWGFLLTLVCMVCFCLLSITASAEGPLDGQVIDGSLLTSESNSEDIRELLPENGVQGYGTYLSYGTAAISNFGLVLFLGITAAYLIAPLVLTIKRQ